MTDLGTGPADHLAAALKAFAGLMPGGSIMAEVIGATLPGQRLDRVAEFVERISERLRQLQVHVVSLGEDQKRLLQVATQQAANAQSADRADRIAKVAAEGLAAGEKPSYQARLLLEAVGSLSDEDLVLLADVGQGKSVGLLEGHVLDEESIFRDLQLRRLFNLGLVASNGTISMSVSNKGHVREQGLALSPSGALILNRLGIGK